MDMTAHRNLLCSGLYRIHFYVQRLPQAAVSCYRIEFRNVVEVSDESTDIHFQSILNFTWF